SESEVPSAGEGVSKPVDVGDLNAKAISLPKPTMSEEAKRVKATGKVQVKVLVDENGKVVSATAVTNVAVRREAPETAARQAIFNPLTQDGITVRFSGILTYEFK